METLKPVGTRQRSRAERNLTCPEGRPAWGHAHGHTERGGQHGTKNSWSTYCTRRILIHQSVGILRPLTTCLHVVHVPLSNCSRSAPSSDQAFLTHAHQSIPRASSQCPPLPRSSRRLQPDAASTQHAPSHLACCAREEARRGRTGCSRDDASGADCDWDATAQPHLVPPAAIKPSHGVRESLSTRGGHAGPERRHAAVQVARCSVHRRGWHMRQRAMRGQQVVDASSR